MVSDASVGIPNEIQGDRARPVSTGETRKRGKRPLLVAYRELRELQPYAKNARTHTPEQIIKLRASLSRFGWTNPILTADNSIIAGHARVLAAIEMANEREAIRGNADPWKAPTIDLSHLSKAERKAYIIADNRLAEDAGWDYDLLRTEMGDLDSLGFDLTLTGFDMGEIGEILVPPAEAEEQAERQLTQAENDMLDVAWRRAIGEWRDIMQTAKDREWVSTSFTKGTLAVLYLRALFLGDDIPRGATLAYTRHRLWTDGNKGTIADIFTQATTDDARNLRNSIRWVSQEKPSFDKIIATISLPIHAHRMPNDFPALLARDLIDEFSLDRGTRILDPCHGWGGRMLGFLLSERAIEYHGFDAAPETTAGVQQIFNDLAPLTPDRPKAATLICQPYETVTLEPGSYDFALTSPPYFDTEKYPGERSSWRMYPDFDSWVAGFYQPLITITAAALKPGALFALQVGSQSYPLVERALAIAPAAGLVHAETRHTEMVNNRTDTEPDKGEVVVLLRRPL